MSWIILALTLGASITSIIHGVFMLFGSLSITAGGALIGMPSTLLASLPIIAAVFALIGGIIAFNQSKWGALFLFTAAGICAPARDTWLYAGLYFFAAMFCFFLKKKDSYIYGGDDYDDLDPNSGLDPDSDSDLESDSDSDSDFGLYPPKRGQSDDDDFYYEEQIVPRQPKPKINLDTLELEEEKEPEVISRFQAVPSANEQPVKVRTRPSKTCPTCGMNVARDAKFCSQCGTKLFVAPEVMAGTLEHEHDDVNLIVQGQSQQAQTQTQIQIREQKDEPDFQPMGINSNTNNINNNDGDGDNEMEMMDYAYRVSLNDAGGRHEQRFHAQGQGSRKARKNPAMSDDAASSYRDFSDSKYSKRGKKRRRSPFRRILSILLLVGAVGGALYFLLGLRKLPPGDLPPIAKPEVVRVNNTNNEPRPPARDVNNDTNIVEPVDVVVAENILPNFTPNRTPTSGVITGNGVNVRADHSTGSARVTRLSNGAKVEVIDSWTGRSGNLNGTWYNIRTGGKDGWVYGQYMQALGSGLPDGYSNGLLKSFGNNKAQLIETLGQPSKSSSTSAEWQGLTATLKGDDITRIRLSSSRHELQNGLKVGMSQTALLQIMGFPSSVNKNTMNYNEGSSSSTGVSVGLDRSNLITSITVNAVK